jgi:hypothetical protein
MEATMKTTKTIGMALLALGLLAGTAAAGAKTKAPVWIQSDGLQASGSPGSARNSTDTVQQIGCTVMGYSNEGAINVSCHAVDSTGRQAGCYTQYPTQVMLDAVRAISDSSWIWFATDADNQCTMILTSTSSVYEPKK